ncbi:MAG: PIN domain-containing protein [Thermoplasmatota archaeon]|jgi:rRNA-processing protein FCF1
MAFDWLRQHKDTIILLDSNAVMMLFEFSIDLEDQLTQLFGKYKIVIPKIVIDELTFLSEHGKGKKKIIAKPALKLIEKYEVVNTIGSGDQAIIDLAKKLNCIVLTNDKKLREKLKKLSLHSVYLRNKSKLVYE